MLEPTLQVVQKVERSGLYHVDEVQEKKELLEL